MGEIIHVIYPVMGEIRFVGTGETRRYSYLVCKKRCLLMASSRNRVPEKGVAYP